MAHDAKKTNDYIFAAYHKYSKIQDPVDRSYHAWAYLRGVRRRGDDDVIKKLKISVPDDPAAPYDESLEDAEHYAYARFLASRTGDPQTGLLVTGYEAMKFVGAVGRSNSKYPALPASPETIQWGLKGVDYGLTEYKSAHGGKTGKPGSAMECNRDFIKGILWQSDGKK